MLRMFGMVGMFRRGTWMFGVLAAATFVDVISLDSAGQGFWYPGSGGACQNCGGGFSSRSQSSQGFQGYSAANYSASAYSAHPSVSNQAYSAVPMTFVAPAISPAISPASLPTIESFPISNPQPASPISSADFSAQQLDFQTIPDGVYDQGATSGSEIPFSTVLNGYETVVDQGMLPPPVLMGEATVPVEGVLGGYELNQGIIGGELPMASEGLVLSDPNSTSNPEANVVGDVIPNALADSTSSPNDTVNAPTGNADETAEIENKESELKSEANSATEKLKLELAASIDRARQADERVYAAEKAAMAAEQSVKEKQEALAAKVAVMEAKLKEATTNSAENAEKAAKLGEEVEELEKTKTATLDKMKKEVSDARALAKKVEDQTNELKEVQAKLIEAQAALKKADAKAAQLTNPGQPKVSPAQLKSLEDKLKAVEQRLEKTLADKEALAKKLNQADKQPAANEKQPKAPQRARRPRAERRNETKNLTQDQKQSEERAKSSDSKKIADLKEKIRVIEETMKVKLEQSKSRITNRIEEQKKQLLDSGLKKDDSKLVDLDKKLRAELNNSSTKIRSEHSAKMDAIRAVIEKLEKEKK